MSSFNDLFGDAEIDIECPNCKKSFTIMINQIGSTVVCPSCQSSVELKKDSSFNDSVENITDALDEFNETFKNFGD